ncbi:hypothetical protein BAME_12460 [Bacillus sp. M 2-6]|nr:hypothetical protein BAME_12460 [Bacillus sp. M 2-6]
MKKSFVFSYGSVSRKIQLMFFTCHHSATHTLKMTHSLQVNIISSKV